MKFTSLITIIILLCSWVAPTLAQTPLPEKPAETAPFVGSELIIDKEWLARLDQTGFLTSLPVGNQIYLHYLDHRLPAFVTADSLLRTYQIIYQETISQLEEASAERLLLLSRRLNLRIAAGLATLPPARTRAALERNLAVWQLVTGLFDEATREQLPATVIEEIHLIEQADSKQRSPLLGEIIDYRDFQLPAGFSANRQSYTRALRWLGNWSIALDSEAGAREALLLLNEFAFDELLVKLWQEIEQPRNYLYGPAEMQLLQLLPTVKYILGRALISNAEIGDSQIATFRRLLTRQAKPRERFRLFGLHNGLETVLRPLAQPRQPFTGLDLALLLGAEIKTDQTRPTPERLERARQTLAIWQLRNADSYQSRLLDCYRALLKPARDRRIPDFARHPAWHDRLVTTLLASWAGHSLPSLPASKSTRSNADSTAYHENFHGYVEPNIAFFYQLRNLTDGLRGQLSDIRLRTEPLDDFIQLITQLARMVEKELAGIEFSEAEIDLLENYGERLAQLSFIAGNYLEITSEQGFITTIGATTESPVNLAVGRSLSLYVVVPYKDKRYLCRGGVSSYYQSSTPIAAEAITGLPLTLPYQQSYLLLDK